MAEKKKDPNIEEAPQAETSAGEEAATETAAAEQPVPGSGPVQGASGEAGESLAVEETSPEAPTADAEAPVPAVPEQAAEEAPATEDEDAKALAAERPVRDSGSVEATSGEPGGAPDEAAAFAPAGEKKKRKRVPRSERRQRSKIVRQRPAERKSITRLPKPESERGRRQERRGVVVSNAMDKTIVVKVDTIKSHPRYKKVVRRSVKFHAHDERNQANVGDVVRIVETRPLSKTKNWRLAEVVEVAK
jgi:small subunit ribosomal protein S17